MPQASLQRALQVLLAKRIVDAGIPLSTRPSRETRYTVADPHLRFWLTFLGPHLAEIERGAGDRVTARIRAGWTTWRGRVVEPVVREALRRMPAGILPEGSDAVRGYWTRTNDPEIDLVGADRAPIARRARPGPARGAPVEVAGGRGDRAAAGGLRSGATVDGIMTLGPEELVAAYR